MKKTPLDIKVNVLALATISGGVLVWLSDGRVPPEAVNILASLWIGGLITTILQMVEPKPNPMVAASAVANLLGIALPEAHKPSAWRPNLLVLTLFGAGLAAVICWMAGFSAAAITIAGGMVGAIAATMNKLVDPDEPSVPASLVKDILDAYVATQTKATK